MKAYSILSEILYVLACYEKGRIKTRGFWSRRYLYSLSMSIHCLYIVLEWMKNPMNVQSDAITWVENFCIKNIMVIFPEFETKKLREVTLIIDESTLSQEQKVIVVLMSDMIKECMMLLKQRKKGYKQRVAMLIKAFHNLPKIFFDLSGGILFKLGSKPISIEEALEYASTYMTN